MIKGQREQYVLGEILRPRPRRQNVIRRVLRRKGSVGTETREEPRDGETGIDSQKTNEKVITTRN